VRHLLPDGGETPYPAYELRGTAFVAGWRRNALSGLRTAECGFCCRMAAKTPYPAYKLRVRLLLPDGGENALSGLRTAGCGLCCRIAAKTPYPA